MNRRFTQRAERVFSLSENIAKSLGHKVIGTEHLLLALIEEGEGIAAKALKELGLDFEKIKNNSIQIQTLTQTRDALLPKLMSGELEIKN